VTVFREREQENSLLLSLLLYNIDNHTFVGKLGTAGFWPEI